MSSASQASSRHGFLPHAVSLLRPALGVVVLAALPTAGDSAVLLAIVLLGCATDWLDGELARRAGRVTRAGRLVDNLCDFAFLLCIFVHLAECRAWSPPVWGRLVRNWDGTNALPAYALVASFGVYFVRICREFAAGRDPERSPRGHTAGVANYLLAVAGAVEMLPGVALGPWLLEPAIVGVALLNLAAVGENLRLIFHRQGGGPSMGA